MTLRHCLTMLACAAFLQGCIYVPRTSQVYNQNCQIVERQMTLEQVQVAEVQRCRNQDCVAMIVIGSVVSAASVVISGSIVVTGNIVYWLEERSQCQRPAW